MTTASRQEKFSGTKEVTEGLRFEPQRLDEYLRQHLEGYDAPCTVQQFRGGQSCPTYLVTTAGRKYVLRRKPPGALLPSAHAVDREFRVLSALHGSGIPVAQPRLLCLDESVVGTIFYLMDYVEGRVFWEPLLPDLDRRERSAVYDAMNATLARLHNLDYGALDLESFGKPGNYFARQIHRWSKQYRLSETATIEAMDRLIEWLPENIPAGDDSCVVHGDYRIDNMIFHPERPEILAILDWELSTIGHPLGDFTYHCMQWENRGALVGADLESLGIPDLETYKTAYCARTGRDSMPNWEFYAAYNLFRGAAIAQGIAGRIRDGTAASTHAHESAAAVRPTAELAWSLVGRM